MQIDSRTELVVASDIARRLGVTRQRINQLQAQPGFPKPIGRLANSNVWKWTQIARWAEETGRTVDRAAPGEASEASET